MNGNEIQNQKEELSTNNANSSSSSSSSSSSDDDDDVDERRRRIREKALLAKQQKQKKQNESIIKQKTNDDNEESEKEAPLMQKDTKDITTATEEKQKVQTIIKKTQSSSDSESESESESEEESSSSEEEHTLPSIAKPVFIPRNKRGAATTTGKGFEASKNPTLRTPENGEEEEDQQDSDQIKKKREKRILQSRALVAQIMQQEKEESDKLMLYENNEDDETGGTMEPPPWDDDEVNENGTPYTEAELNDQRDSWQVRELLRYVFFCVVFIVYFTRSYTMIKMFTQHYYLSITYYFSLTIISILQAHDLREQEEKELKELEHRRTLTDAQIMQLQKGANKNNKGENGYMYLQRYHHRGAFYIDEDGLSKDDIRHKAKEYSRQATKSEKSYDKRKLPEIMQVKKFGISSQSTKYKGLRHEDTSDKTGRGFLPISKNKKRQKR